MRVAKSSSGVILLALASVLHAQPPAAGPGGGRGGPRTRRVLPPHFSIPRGIGSHRSRKTGRNASIPRRKATSAASRSARPAAARLPPGTRPQPTHARLTASAESFACPDAFTLPGKGITSRSNPTPAPRLACSRLERRAAKLGACRVSPSLRGIVSRLLSAASRWEDAAGAEALLKSSPRRLAPAISRATACPTARRRPSPNTMIARRVPGGPALLVVSVEVTDPDYLNGPYWYSVHFKKQADAAGWNPQPCDAR